MAPLRQNDAEEEPPDVVESSLEPDAEGWKAVGILAESVDAGPAGPQMPLMLEDVRVD